jgi:hypothetical protein
MVLGYLGGTALADACRSLAFIVGRRAGRAPTCASRSSSRLVAGIAGSYYFYTINKRLEARLKLLEAQLEPHMLFNTLANLRVLIATDRPAPRPCWTT